MATTFAKLDDKAVRKYLAGIKNKMRFPAKVMRTFANIWGFKDIIKHFREERGEKGKWQRRSKATQLKYAMINQGKAKPPRGTARRAYNPANKILQLTGMMRKSLIGGNAKIIGKESVLLKTNVPYSGKHDRGIPGKLVKRNFMWISAKAKENMLRGMLEFLVKG